MSEWREGGGYSAITEGVCTALHKLGHEIKLLAFAYDGSQHPFPFSVIPLLSPEHIGIQIEDIVKSFFIDAVVVAFDLPHHLTLVPHCRAIGGFKYIGIFPVESKPVYKDWIETINQMEGRLTLSRFGVEACAEKGADVHLLPVSCTPNLPVAKPEDIAKMRKHIRADGRFAILKIADNTTRKNWESTIRFFGQWHKPGDIIFAVTRPENQQGWDLGDLATRWGAVQIPNTKVWEWDDGAQLRVLAGLRRNDIAWLLNVSDVLLQDTANEGLGMPILEAFASNLLVVGMNHTAIAELLADGRGILFPSGHEFQDPFGNVDRWYPGEEGWCAALDQARVISKEDRINITTRAHQWLKTRSWQQAAEVLVQEIQNG